MNLYTHLTSLNPGDIRPSERPLAWPLRRKFVASIVIGVRNQDQLASNLEPGDWDMPEDVWKALEEQTRPEEEYHTWLNRMSYERIFAAADFHDERAELL